MIAQLRLIASYNQTNTRATNTESYKTTANLKHAMHRNTIASNFSHSFLSLSNAIVTINSPHEAWTVTTKRNEAVAKSATITADNSPNSTLLGP